jgi:galactokinase/mevalonate kinase-like predicted kinase
MNRMFLVCTHHPQMVDAIAIGRRNSFDGYRTAANAAALEKWLDTHKDCGGTQDHYTIAYENTKDHDKSQLNGASAQ